MPERGRPETTTIGRVLASGAPARVDDWGKVGGSFAELMLRSYELLRDNDPIREHYRRRFRHVLVDEYQDTNHAQYTLVRELIGTGADGVPPGELCVVGDADQSIYAFRGATIRNIDEFERDYPQATTILLEQNYRSTQRILKAANTVIAKNTGRRPKNLWTDSGDGERPSPAFWVACGTGALAVGASAGPAVKLTRRRCSSRRMISATALLSCCAALLSFSIAFSSSFSRPFRFFTTLFVSSRSFCNTSFCCISAVSNMSFFVFSEFNISILRTISPCVTRILSACCLR